MCYCLFVDGWCSVLSLFVLLHADVVVAWCCCNVLSRVLVGGCSLLLCAVCRGNVLIVVVCLLFAVRCCLLLIVLFFVLLLPCVVCSLGLCVVAGCCMCCMLCPIGVVDCLVSLRLLFVVACRCYLLLCVETCW